MAKSKRTVKVNMKDVETSVLIPEGDYIVEVNEVEVAESENSGKEYLKWKFEIADGDCKGQYLYHNTSLQPQALFNLKGVLISMGVPVPNNTLSLDLDDLEGRQLGVTVEHEIYDGKKKARVTETFPPDGVAESEDEEDDSEVDLSTMDLDELIAYAGENDIELGLKKKDLKDKAKVLAAIEAATASDEEEDEEESDDEAEEEATDDEGPDFDGMNLKQLKAFAEENDIEIPSKIAKKEDKVRAYIVENYSAEEEEPEEDDAPDFDEMDLKALLAYAKENDIAISKKIKDNEKKVRAAVKAAAEDDED